MSFLMLMLMFVLGALFGSIRRENREMDDTIVLLVLQVEQLRGVEWVPSLWLRRDLQEKYVAVRLFRWYRLMTRLVGRGLVEWRERDGAGECRITPLGVRYADVLGEMRACERAMADVATNN